MSAEVEYRCFVGGLAWATDDEALQRAFSPYGDILESKIINDRETGRSRGFGFVTFGNEKAMRDAIEAATVDTVTAVVRGILPGVVAAVKEVAGGVK
ncbi:hypothetical protein FH972_004992 [Carpinus fangiana]|uniref:RRM domain-containing protein n=1 Tax=Carpinus fangiana TaxID=176857 RepID=A0A5N6QNM1_9ROSI|nr:hypothetical protein FH972_004992 [Carpinus fangiana]